MNSPKKSSKEDPFCDSTDGTYTFAVFVVVENNSTPVFTEEYNSELTSFASMSSPGTYSGTTWQSSLKKYCSSSEDAILLSLLLFSVLLFCAVFLRCGCVQKEKEEASSVSQRSRRERERERIERNGEKKILKKKRTKSFWLLVLLGLFFLFYLYGQPSEVGNFQPRKQKHFVSFVFWNLLSRRNASTEDEVVALALYAMDLRSSRGQHARSKVAHLTLFVLMAIGTCSGTSGFSLLTPSGIAIFALVKAKRWWCPAKSFALWIFKSQSVHKNARSSRQTTETGLDLQISHGISFASCCVISVARSLDGLHFLVVTQRLHAVLFPHPTTNVASCGHISHFNFIVCS